MKKIDELWKYCEIHMAPFEYVCFNIKCSKNFWCYQCLVDENHGDCPYLRKYSEIYYDIGVIQEQCDNYISDFKNLMLDSYKLINNHKSYIDQQVQCILNDKHLCSTQFIVKFLNDMLSANSRIEEINKQFQNINQILESYQQDHRQQELLFNKEFKDYPLRQIYTSDKTQKLGYQAKVFKFQNPELIYLLICDYELDRRLTKENQYDSAIIVVDEYLSHDPNNFSLLGRKCEYLALAGKFDKALSLVENLLENENRLFLLEIKGCCLAIVERYTEALEISKQLYGYSGNSIIKSYCLIKERRYIEATKMNNESGKNSDLQNKLYYLNEGYCLAMIGSQSLAIKNFQIGLQTEPGNCYQLGMEGKHDVALQRIEEALLTYPYDALLLATKAYCLAMKGLYDKSVDLIDQTFEKTANFVFPLSIKKIGYCLAMQMNYTEANILIDQALKINQQAWYSSSIKSYCLAMQGKPHEAFGLIQEVMKRDLASQNAFYLNIKGIILRQQGNCLKQFGKYDEALQLYDEALKLDRYNMKVLSFKGEVLLIQGKRSEALEYIDLALRIAPFDEFSLDLKNKTIIV